MRLILCLGFLLLTIACNNDPRAVGVLKTIQSADAQRVASEKEESRPIKIYSFEGGHCLETSLNALSRVPDNHGFGSCPDIIPVAEETARIRYVCPMVRLGSDLDGRPSVTRLVIYDKFLKEGALAQTSAEDIDTACESIAPEISDEPVSVPATGREISLHAETDSYS